MRKEGVYILGLELQHSTHQLYVQGNGKATREEVTPPMECTKPNSCSDGSVNELLLK